VRVRDLIRQKVWFAWRNMVQRCHDPKSRRYADWGGRGIVVCDRWRASFEAFLADVGNPPSQAHTLDRRDNDRGYEPDNCRWATRQEQQRNRRGLTWLTVTGERVLATDLAERLGLTVQAVMARIARGMTGDEIVATPKSKRGRPRKTDRRSA
jgi:hypothetical protein